jgi:hypothetical protein
MQENISRRGFLVGSAVVGVGAIAAGASSLKVASAPYSAGDSGASTLTDGAERSLVVIPPSDPRFGDMVDEHFPALIGDKTFDALKAVSVVLHNKQGPAIHAHKLKWTFTFDSDIYSTELSSFWRPRPAKFCPVAFCSRSANRPVLKKGGVSLVSPFFTLISGKSPRQEPINWKRAIRRKALQEFLSQRLPQIKQTSVTIASAVYHDYSVLDTDNGKFAELLMKMRNTEIQTANAVLKRLNEGVPDPRLQGVLNRTYNAPRYNGNRMQEIFHQARKQHARYLHDVLLNEGRDKLLDLVLRQRQLPLTRFRRLTAS